MYAIGFLVWGNFDKNKKNHKEEKELVYILENNLLSLHCVQQTSLFGWLYLAIISSKHFTITDSTKKQANSWIIQPKVNFELTLHLTPRLNSLWICMNIFFLSYLLMIKQPLWPLETHHILPKITVKGGFCDGSIIATKIENNF